MSIFLKMDTNSNFELESLEKQWPQLITKFRAAATESGGITIPDECDELIKRCLRLKDFDQEKALKLVNQFGVMINDLKSWNTPLQPTVHEKFYRDIIYSLPKRDALGRRIILIRIGTWDPNESSYEVFLSAYWTMMQYASYEYPDAQRNGLVFVVDCRGFNMQHAMAIKILRSVNFLKWMQSGTACRFKAAHMIYTPKALHVLYATMRPLLSEKINQRLIFYGEDLTGLFEHVPPAVLPPDIRYNTEVVVNDNYVDRNFHEGLVKQDNFFKTWIEHGWPAK